MLALPSIALAALAGTAPWAAGPPKPPVSAAACAAVMLSLDEYFSGYFTYGKVYVQAGDYVPAKLNRVGRYDAEVISEADLRKRFEGKETAPAFARLSVSVTERKGETVCEVGISYTGLPTKGAKAIPLGGGKSYTYKVRGGKAELVKTGVVRY